MESSTVYILNIDNLLRPIEDTLTPYHDFINAVFIPGKRFPVTGGDKEHPKASSTPHHPFLSAIVFKDVLELYFCENSAFKELLFTNPLVEGLNTPLYSISKDMDIHDILYGSFPKLRVDDVNKIVDTFKTILYSTLPKQLVFDSTCVYEIEIESSEFIVHNKGPIKAIRFDELDRTEDHKYNSVEWGVF